MLGKMSTLSTKLPNSKAKTQAPVVDQTINQPTMSTKCEETKCFKESEPEVKVPEAEPEANQLLSFVSRDNWSEAETATVPSGGKPTVKFQFSARKSNTKSFKPSGVFE